MAEVRPFQGLRYDPERAGPLNTVVAPPYDVISPAQQRALHDASPYNIVQLEYGMATGPARYAEAARLLTEWQRDGVLRQDTEPALYLYEQRFRYAGQDYRRRSVFCRLRLQPFETGIVRPHEYTMSGPKEDRRLLLAATHANISPIFTLYRSGPGDPLAGLVLAEGSGAIAQATDINGEQHLLLPLTDPALHQAVTGYIAPRTLFIADGHHRYETALAYRDACRAAADNWSGDEPENFVLTAMAAADDPGLLILPIHRIVRLAAEPTNLVQRLRATFDVTALEGDAAEPATLRAALQALQRETSTAFIAAGLVPGRLALLALRDRAAVEALMPAERSDAWKALAVNVLQYGVLDAGLQIDLDAITKGGAIEFTESADEAVAEVNFGRVPLAFLVNPVQPEEIFAVADTGDRMPQKSTYFYPKLGTGLVINSLR